MHMPSLGGATEWLEFRATRPRPVAGPSGRGQLLDVYLYQLATHGAMDSCLVITRIERRVSW